MAMATKVESRRPAVKDLYNQDFAACSSEQADLLRARRFAELDLAHLAKEVAGLGHRERDALRSQVRRMLEHSPASEPRDGWKDALTDARSSIEDKLSTSLRSDLEAMLPRLCAQTLPKARRALRRFGEREAARALPAICPYTLDEICRPEWLPETATACRRHRLTDRGRAAATIRAPGCQDVAGWYPRERLRSSRGRAA